MGGLANPRLVVTGLPAEMTGEQAQETFEGLLREILGDDGGRGLVASYTRRTGDLHMTGIG